jgi:hypothetical protein
MFLDDAFNQVLKLNARPMTLERIGQIPVTAIQATPSSYSRSLEFEGQVTISGREYVISARELLTYGMIKRGDRLVDPQFGDFTVAEVVEMMALGYVIGYRVRTQ